MFYLSAGAVLALLAGGALGRFARDPVDQSLRRSAAALATPARPATDLAAALWTPPAAPSPVFVPAASARREDGASSGSIPPPPITIDPSDDSPGNDGAAASGATVAPSDPADAATPGQRDEDRLPAPSPVPL
jgi:hypothetical protein